MILSVHQPNFFPWLPYFRKIQASNVFVSLGNVQFVRRQYQNRFYFDEKWHTMSVNSGSQTDRIRDKIYLNPEKDWEKIKRSIRTIDLSRFDSSIGENLYETNHAVIKIILNNLGITTPVFHESQAADTDPSMRIIQLCLKYGADTYLSGPSGIKYMNLELFKRNGIKVDYMAPDKDDAIPILNLL